MEVTRIDEFNNSKISLNRKILSWGWYTEPKTAHLFIHCLLRANFKDDVWRGLLIKRGQFVTGRLQLAIETGLTEMQIRTALKHLKMTNEITIKSTKQYSIITVNKYDEYQNNYRTTNQQLTNKQPSDNQAITTNNNDNNDNNISSSSSSENEKINFYGEYYNVFLTEEQYKKLEVLIMDKKMMKVILDDFSVNIETGKEKQFNPELPNAHFERVKAYFNYRKKHPKKVQEKEDEKGKQEKDYWEDETEYRPY